MSAAPKYKREYGGSLHRMAKPKGKRAPVILAPNHPAMQESRPLFQTAVHASESPRLLVSGMNSRKIGRKVTKGAWAGMPIYTLTLEERATCPRSCTEWATCYGNNMPFARRHRLDEDLIVHLMMELREAALKHPGGFVVRAHVLGDFGSTDNPELALCYVSMWRLALDEIEALHMFSYTAHGPETDIGRAIRSLNSAFPFRSAAASVSPVTTWAVKVRWLSNEPSNRATSSVLPNSIKLTAAEPAAFAGRWIAPSNS